MQGSTTAVLHTFWDLPTVGVGGWTTRPAEQQGPPGMEHRVTHDKGTSKTGHSQGQKASNHRNGDLKQSWRTQGPFIFIRPLLTNA